MEQIIEILKGVIHPETGRDIVTMGMVENVRRDESRITLTIRLCKAHDPMAGSIRRAAEALVAEQTGIVPTIIVIDGGQGGSASLDDKSVGKATAGSTAGSGDRPTAGSGAKQGAKQGAKHVTKHVKGQPGATSSIKRIIAIASGKGGVGKSTVTANLAIALARMGHSVGVIDADIYGPSMPKMFGVEGHTPLADEADQTQILPAMSHGVKLQSIGFFVSPSDALIWRGPMATNALRQLLHQTAWGELDFLLIDLPPGTGDLHLTIVGDLEIDGSIIVTTPSAVAVADVVRGISMFGNENVGVRVLGVVNNMAYFTPAELPMNKYYVFGRGNVERVVEELGIPILGEIPLVEGVSRGGDGGEPIALGDTILGLEFQKLAQTLVEAF